jgi:hypothetical protein
MNERNGKNYTKKYERKEEQIKVRKIKMEMTKIESWNFNKWSALKNEPSDRLNAQCQKMLITQK